MLDDCWIWSADWRIPSQHGAGKAVEDEILDQLRKHDWIEHDVFGVHLALEERPGQRHHSRRSPLCDQAGPSRVQNVSRRLWIRVSDEGCGFCPETWPDPADPANLERPCGRGIMLMRNFMYRVAYNETGNCVEMEKIRRHNSNRYRQRSQFVGRLGFRELRSDSRARHPVSAARSEFYLIRDESPSEHGNSRNQGVHSHAACRRSQSASRMFIQSDCAIAAAETFFRTRPT